MIGVSEVIERIFTMTVAEVAAAGRVEGRADRARYDEAGMEISRASVRRRAESFANALGAYGEEAELAERRAAYISAFEVGWEDTTAPQWLIPRGRCAL